MKVRNNVITPMAANTIPTLESAIDQGFQSGDVLKIVAQRKSEWPELVTDKNEKTIMSWCSPGAVYEYTSAIRRMFIA